MTRTYFLKELKVTTKSISPVLAIATHSWNGKRGESFNRRWKKSRNVTPAVDLRRWKRHPLNRLLILKLDAPQRWTFLFFQD